MDKLKTNGLCEENRLGFERSQCFVLVFFYWEYSLVHKDTGFPIFLTLLISAILLARDASWESLGL